MFFDPEYTLQPAMMSYDPGRIHRYAEPQLMSYDPGRIDHYAKPVMMSYDPGRIAPVLQHTETEFESDITDYPTSGASEQREVLPLVRNPPIVDDHHMSDDPAQILSQQEDGNVSNETMSYDPGRSGMMSYVSRQVEFEETPSDGIVEDNERPNLFNRCLVRLGIQFEEQQRRKAQLGKVVGRVPGIVSIPFVFVFGIILYLVDIGSDILAAVDHFQEGNPIWGSLTITFVILPALCWASVSWVWWYTYKPEERKNVSNQQIEQYKRERRTRMLLAILLLDPLIRYRDN